MSSTAYVFIFAIFCLINQGYSWTNYPSQMRHQVYDYIIVGGGSSGAVVANRLSEDKNVTVLLLEAGGPPQRFADIPYYSASVKQNKTSAWIYLTETQEGACLSQNEQKCTYNVYKGLGGCSNHNGMVFVRGASSDYDNWAKLGALGWEWKNVLPFFKKLENINFPGIENNGYHGKGGPVTISGVNYKTRLQQAYIEAGKFLGYENGTNVDYNGPSQIGFFEPQVNIRDGRRCGTEMAYLRPIAERPNLDIMTHAHVLKVNIDKQQMRATSVVFDHENKTKTVSARKEIILSAGVFGSSKLLLLSGIGPKKHLQEVGIPLVADLPVGQNFHDHVSAGVMIWNYNQSVLFYTPEARNEIAEYIEGKGLLSSPSGNQNVMFVNSKYENASNWPDLQMEIFVILPNLSGERSKSNSSFILMNTKPKSRGFVKLRSSDPYDAPVINPRFLTHEEDILRVVDGMKIVRRIMNTPALQEFGSERDQSDVGDCPQKHDPKSDEYLACVIRRNCMPGSHGAGTNRMGDPNDPNTVVDPELRVKGVSGLRVADASIMPTVVTGNTNAACIMIGEKAASIIKG